MTTRVTYRIFGIPIWSVTRHVDVTDEDAMYQRIAARVKEQTAANEEATYQRLSERFAAEMADALNRVRRPTP